MHLVELLFSLVGIAATAVAAGYATVALVAVLVWHMRRPTLIVSDPPPVTVLKPLCGSEPRLHEHLRSFCLQDHADFQLVFGVSDLADPARAEVERLVEEFPELPIDSVASPQQHGSNRKVSNLINMIPRARHEFLVIADSDVSVRPAYLAAVTAPLTDPKVGLVTCVYRGIPSASLWSRLGAMYVNDWYVPSILLAHAFGYRGYALGPTLCLRRDTLEAVGGLQAIADHLADDYQLGEQIRRLALGTVLSPYMIDTHHAEGDFATLVRHERRWMRTLRVLRPRSFRLLFVTFSLPLAGLGLALASADAALLPVAWSLFGVALAARLALHLAQRPGTPASPLSDLWLWPLRDLLTCWIWCSSFSSYRVTWRGTEFDVNAKGVMRRLC